MAKKLQIVGGLNIPQPDWTQTDETRLDYIKNKPEILTEEEVVRLIEEKGGDVGVQSDWSQTDTTQLDYIKNKPEILTEEEIIQLIAENGGDVGVQSDWNQTDDTQLNYIQNKPDIAGMNSKIATLESQIADILYEPISISAFTHNAGTKEMGATVTNVTLSWSINKTPETLTIDGEAIDVATTSKAISGLSITWNNNKTWTLRATDARDAVATRTTSITFCNNIYYGVGSVEKSFDNAFVTGLPHTLYLYKAYDFTVNPTDQYIYYAVPTRLGTVSFKVGGFEGGFESPETVSVTNESGYTENYYVYRSTNTITGSTAVDVT